MSKALPLTSDVHLRAVKSLAQQPKLHARAYHAAEKAVLISILHGQTLVGEESYLVVEQRKAHSVVVLQEVKGHVRTHIHRPRIVLEAGKTHSVCSRDVEFLLLADSTRVEIRLQVPVVAERHVILGASL